MPKLLKNDLYKFQRRGHHHAYHRKYAALFMEQGTGKTIVTFSVAARRWKRKGVKLVLIICLKTGLGVWRRQAKQHLNIPYTVSENLERAKGAKKLTFITVNFERMWRIKEQLRKIPWDMVVIDESHRLMHRGSRQSRAAAKVGEGARYRLILTGTPTGGQDIHLWAQFRFLVPKLFGTRWADFDNYYLKPTGYMGYKRKFKPWALKEFRKKMKPYVFEIRKNEALDLPPTSFAPVYFQLEPKAQKLYTELENDLVTYLPEDDDFTLASLPVTKVIRLQQLTGGFLKTDSYKLHEVSKAKLNATLEALDGIDKKRKVVIFCRFIPEIERLRKAIKDRTVGVLYGKSKDKDIWMTFQDKKDPNVLIVQSRMGSASIDLFAANYAILHSFGHSFIDYDQLLKRLDRKGQKLPVTYIPIIGEGTVDEDIYKTVENKGEKAEDVLRNLRQRRAQEAQSNGKGESKKEVKSSRHRKARVRRR